MYQIKRTTNLQVGDKSVTMLKHEVIVNAETLESAVRIAADLEGSNWIIVPPSFVGVEHN